MTAAPRTRNLVTAERGSPALSCPSAPAEIPGAVAFGVIDYTSAPPQVMYLEQPVPVDETLLELAAPLDPREVFRFGAPCQTDRCSHWSGHDCQLVERITKLVPIASLVTPPCQIRPSCRWYAQVGRSACMRCPHVVTKDERPTLAMRDAATPESKADAAESAAK